MQKVHALNPARLAAFGTSVGLLNQIQARPSVQKVLKSEMRQEKTRRHDGEGTHQGCQEDSGRERGVGACLLVAAVAPFARKLRNTCGFAAFFILDQDGPCSVSFAVRDSIAARQDTARRPRAALSRLCQTVDKLCPHPAFQVPWHLMSCEGPGLRTYRPVRKLAGRLGVQC